MAHVAEFGFVLVYFKSILVIEPCVGFRHFFIYLTDCVFTNSFWLNYLSDGQI